MTGDTTDAPRGTPPLLPAGVLSSVLALVASLLLGPGPLAAQSAGSIDWAQHHDHEDVTRIVEGWEEQHPDLVGLESIGESIQGRDLWLLTITSEATGAASDKPALWFDAHSDAPQVLTKEVALYFVHDLLSSYGSDERVTRLLDTRTLYIIPNANPDPGEQLIQPPEPGVIQGVSRDGYLYPWDDDGDGRADEDGPEDIDGDGRITSMRVENPHGAWKRHPEIPSLLVRRQAGDGPDDGPYYDRYPTEGVDNDGDGRINEDWLGGFDSNRVFPGNWQPAHRQLGAPPYPLFTPEARALVDAILARSNIAAVISLHTSGSFPGGTLYEPPASIPPSEVPSFDVSHLYHEIGRAFERIMKGDEQYPHSCATAIDARTEIGAPIFGTLIDWTYLNRGIISWTPEVWDDAVDYDGDCSISRAERWRWSEEEWQGRPFIDWSRAEHPALGSVEIGGWRNDLTGRGILPPEGWVDRAEQMIPWFLHAFESLPRVELIDVRSERVGSELHRVRATVKNTGFLPSTSTAYAAELSREGGMETGVRTTVPYAEPVVATVRAPSGEVLSEAEVEVGHLRGVESPEGPSSAQQEWPNHVEVEWVVRAPSGTSVTVRAGAPRAGQASAAVELDG